MATITVTLPDDQMLKLRKDAQDLGMTSPEEMLQSLVQWRYESDPSDPIDSMSPEDKASLEAELVRRLDCDDFVVMDEVGWKSIHADVAAAIAARRKP